jgi:hypothetical protein
MNSTLNEEMQGYPQQNMGKLENEYWYEKTSLPDPEPNVLRRLGLPVFICTDSDP